MFDGENSFWRKSRFAQNIVIKNKFGLMPESAQKCKGMQILSNLTLFITFKLPIFDVEPVQICVTQ